ncbi:MAG: hypothetical protein H7Y13_14030 [Sphingobacteriaceae bacterium]|nr:hypothetical protein [Sphingobacteriaceae bacterium]
MMKSNYQLVLSLEVSHSYYENNACSCLEFIPQKATVELQKKYGFRMRYKTNGFELYANTAGPIVKLLQYIIYVANDASFEYTITSKDSNFMMFTELPLDQQGSLSYDTGFGQNVYDNEVLTLQEQILNVNTSALGSLKISLIDILKCRNIAGAAQMQINYTARATQWQYYVINKSSVQLNNPAVAGTPDIIFDGPAAVTIATGQAALLFTSGSNLIPLTDYPKYKFDLVNNSSVALGTKSSQRKAGKVIFKGLPNPQPSRIGSVVVNGKGQLSSPIYLYI